MSRLWQILYQWSKQHLPLLLLLGLCLLVIFLNYLPGTTLSGWDTLHPEWNLGLYWQRTFYGAWQTHQGLGAPAAQSHLAEITRLIWVWLLQILPSNLNRYAFIMGCYAVGGAGMYLFLRHQWLASVAPRRSRQWLAFLGALFYLFNLIVLQHFYVPLEMFTVHYATFPFIIWTLQLLLEKPTWRRAGLFLLVQVLSTSIAHTATLWYVQTLILGLYALVWSLAQACNRRQYGALWRQFRRTATTLLLVGGLILAGNLFWLAPNLYFNLFHSDNVRSSLVSNSFSPEIFWHNQAFGNLLDVLIGRNFLFNWSSYDFTTHQSESLLLDWEIFYRQQPLLLILYFLGALAVAGAWFAWRRKKRLFWPLGAIWLFSAFFLINLNFPLTPFYEWLRHFDVLNEVLRIVFTKFSIIYLFCLTVGFSETIAALFARLDRSRQPAWQKNTLIQSLVVLLTGTIILPFLPFFYGQLISDKMQVVFPPEYQELRTWLAAQNPTSRLLTLPLNNSNWSYYDWPGALADNPGYQGAGFLWFGFPQAIFDRDFDRWADTNELVFRQFKRALLLSDQALAARVLQQYQIEWILVDSSVLNLAQTPTQNHAEITQQTALLQNLGAQLRWSRGNLQLYHRPLPGAPTNQYLSSPASWIIAQTDNRRVNYDQVYASRGNYLTYPAAISPPSQLTTHYPFTQLLTDRNHLWRGNPQTVQLDAGSVTAGDILTFPARSDLDSLATLARFSYDQQTITVQFLDWHLQVGNQTIPVPQLPVMHFPLTDSPSEILILLGDQYFTLQSGASKFANVTLASGEDFQFTYHNLDEASNRPTASGYILQRSSERIARQPVDWSALTSASTTAIRQSGQLFLTVDRAWVLPLDLPANQQTSCQHLENGGGTVTWTGTAWLVEADNYAISCGLWQNSLMVSNQDYLLSLAGVNWSGRSFKVLLDGSSLNRSLLTQILPPGEFSAVFNTFSSTATASGEQTVILESQSYGTHQTSKNSLTKIEAIPFDAALLSGIMLTSSQYATLTPPATTPLTLTNITSEHGYLYRAHLENPSDAPQLLVLGQTYDPLWQLNVPGSTHVRYNGWANAWLIPAHYRGDVQISYRPQFWAFAGLALLALTSTIIIIMIIWESRPHHTPKAKLLRLFD